MSDMNVSSAANAYKYYQTQENKTDQKVSSKVDINKMSASDRAELVSQLKTEQENNLAKLTSTVSKLMRRQANVFAQTDDLKWKFLAGGNFTVDAKTKAQAQADIAEDGYWGVKQTSQRLFDFASALAGDDVDKMKSMQAAMQKGFKEATKAWGTDLPGICGDTLKAANQLFDDYYSSKETQN